MTKPLLILSLPNSGTTWVTDVLRKNVPELGDYYDEFFNPILNHEFEPTLRQHFGSELACCYRNIATVGTEETEGVLRDLWHRRTGGRPAFTKENYSPFKLEAFSSVFRVVVLLRHTSGVFPPSRARVWSFYEHAWQALEDSGRFELHEHSLRARCMEAHRIMAKELRKDAIERGIPILYYEDFFTDERLTAQLEEAGLNYPGVFEGIRSTRLSKRIAWEHAY